jgi:hypothetical protein
MSAHKSLTELAASKKLRAHRERREGARYGTAIAESNAEPYEQEAAELLKLEHAPVVGAGGEVVAPQVVGIQGTHAVAVETLKAGATRIAEDASMRRTELLLQPSFNALAMGVDAAESVGAGNSLEKMLAHQMAVAHEAAMRMIDRGLSYEHGRFGDQVEACRCLNTAARLISAFQDGLVTLQRLRTGGNQTVTVQHVNVAPGGQAVIGNVQSGGRKRRGSKPKNG